MTAPTTPASPRSPTNSNKPSLEKSKGNEQMEHQNNVEVITRLNLDLVTVGKENRIPLKAKLAALEEPETLFKDTPPTDETNNPSNGQLHKDKARMQGNLRRKSMELDTAREGLASIRAELASLKRNYIKQKSLLDIYRAMVQAPLELKDALKKQNDELCDRMDELADTNRHLAELRKKTQAGKTIRQPAVRQIERGTLVPIKKKPPETKEELEEALAKANRCNVILLRQNTIFAQEITALKMELTKYQEPEESDSEDDNSDDDIEYDNWLGVSKHSSICSPFSTTDPTLDTKDAHDYKGCESETRSTKSASASVSSTLLTLDSKPNGENNSFNEIKPNDENKSYEVMPNDENESFMDKLKGKNANMKDEQADHKNIDEVRHHDASKGGANKGNEKSKDANEEDTSQVAGTNAKKRGWDDKKEDEASTKRVTTENFWKDSPVADFRLKIGSGGYMTSADFVQLITNNGGPSMSSN